MGKLLLGSLALVGMLTSCDGGVSANGNVVDSKHQAIGGARVLLSRGEHSREFKTTSNKSGCFNLGGTVAPGRYKYTLLVQADGYKFAFADVATLQKNHVEVTLEPTSSPATSHISAVSGTTCRE